MRFGLLRAFDEMLYGRPYGRGCFWAATTVFYLSAPTSLYKEEYKQHRVARTDVIPVVLAYGGLCGEKRDQSSSTNHALISALICRYPHIYPTGIFLPKT